MTYEVLAAMLLKMQVLWTTGLAKLENTYLRFGKAAFHLTYM